MVTPDMAGGGPEPLQPEPVQVVPLTVVTQGFPARPSALPDARDFVRRQLAGTPVSDDDVRTLVDRVAQVLLEAAGIARSIQLSLRIFPDGAEVDVLFAADSGQPPAGTLDRPDGDGKGLGFGLGPGAPARHDNRPEHPTRPENRVAARPPEQRDRPRQDPDGPAAAPRPTADDTAPSFAAWLAARLRREGLSIQAAARRLDVSAKTVSRWLGGTTEPRLRDLYRIREVFGDPPIH